MDKADFDQVRGELFAMQLLLAGVLAKAADISPDAREAIVDGIDVAANAVEVLSMQHGPRVGYLPIALELIEQIRSQVKGKDQPKHGV